MIGAALLIPAGLLATQITISEVSAQRDGGRIAITVKGDAMIDPEAASAKLSDGRLYLFVRDARVREANRAWDNGVEDGAEEIRAHRHKQRVELSVPLGDSGCQGPVEFEPTPGGLRALVACEGGPRPAVARAKDVAATKPAPRTDAASKVATPAPLSLKDVAALKAKLALDPAPGETPTPGPVAADVKTSPVKRPPADVAPPKSAVVAAAAAAPPKPSAAAAAGAPPRPAAGVSIGAGDPRPAASPRPPSVQPPLIAGAGRANLFAIPAPPPSPLPGAEPATAAGASIISGGPMLAGFVLVAIAAAAFFLSRRRRGVSRHIEILETASLGPKRALIVARVGGARMILSSSEAGITLIQTLPEPGADKDVNFAALVAETPPIEEAQWDAMVTATLTPPIGVPAATPSPAATAAAALAALETPAPTLLPMMAPISIRAPASRAEMLVRADDMKIEVEEAPNPTSAISFDTDEVRPVGQAGVLARLFRRGAPANDAAVARFEDVLEDSFEDQELRRKLALGLPGRVR